ncbi:hypothetical protein A2961_02225 [Candidatus Woesebacteria bacterium RIFCSPLOWO2_01_FULL_39_21]|uniref:Uncharacterized protein n=1 Tax=Candidatus Woesebacteria bacterium RIFCSPLOWO2_01_FULL_39_21 TaxID=1802519 RepID=A0A1F8BB97_9BACT|nr:MAG: hypothetical protein A2961_02225 [Candidatus Woesebacteria bacterium RIFCSPLOWO2_01_FULL_39_21]
MLTPSGFFPWWFWLVGLSIHILFLISLSFIFSLVFKTLFKREGLFRKIFIVLLTIYFLLAIIVFISGNLSIRSL